MDELDRFQSLNEAASHLSCALEGLATTGYERLVVSLRVLLEMIDGEISRLERGRTPDR